MRIHLSAGRMTIRQADLFSFYLSSLPQVKEAKVYERTGDAVIVYAGERSELIRQILQFRFDDEALKELVPKNSGRAINQEYEEKLANINKEAEEILSATRKKALANGNRIEQEAKAEAARIVARARVEADLEKKKMADDVKREMVSIASVLAGKMIGASVDASMQERLIDETWKEIGDRTWLS